MQLKLLPKELKQLGFKKRNIAADEFNSAKAVYELPLINSVFYYNPDETTYVWYYRTDIEERSNHIHLDIEKFSTLLMLFLIFGLKVNYGNLMMKYN